MFGGGNLPITVFRCVGNPVMYFSFASSSGLCCCWSLFCLSINTSDLVAVKVDVSDAQSIKVWCPWLFAGKRQYS